ncbi:MAG: lysophospholipid acyltransferase family protein [Candidatus Margulisbacteria bacterium]|nr:lysophospholipid acyltransferase family protein [Candidatus Margulisiibacteriota bacterium]
MIFFVKLLQFCFRIIFFAPVAVALNIMYAAAWLIQALARLTRLRSTVINNIAQVIPESPAALLADKLISNTSYSIFEILCVPFFKRKHYQAIIEWQGLENLTQALKEHKGVIILTMHTGNYELTHAALSNLGYPMNIVLRATNEPIFEIINRSRSSEGARLINVLDSDMYKESLKVLDKNELIYLLADTGALESRHETIDFLGKKVPAATGWLTLAQRSGCAVIPTLAKKSGRRNTITLHKPIKVTKENREEAMRKILGTFEAFIKANPEQWAMFLNAFETKRMIGGK